MKRQMSEHRLGFALTMTGALSLLAIILSVWSHSGGISLQHMDFAVGMRLSRILATIGLWLTVLSPLALFAGYLSHDGYNKCIPLLLLWTFLFSVAVSVLLFFAGLSPPMEAVAVVDGIVGLLVFLRTHPSDRGTVVLSMSCMFLAVVVISSWWVMSYGSAHVISVATMFSEARTAQIDANEMEQVRRFAPIYANAMTYAACLPIMLVTAFGGMALASLCRRHP